MRIRGVVYDTGVELLAGRPALTSTRTRSAPTSG